MTSLLIKSMILLHILFSVLSTTFDAQGESLRPSKKFIASKKIDQSSRDDPRKKFEREQLYEAYNMLHKLAQVLLFYYSSF